MPNWVTNKLNISSDNAEVIAFVKERVSAPNNDCGTVPFSLNAIAEQPSSLSLRTGYISTPARITLEIFERSGREKALSYFAENVANDEQKKNLFYEDEIDPSAKIETMTIDDFDYFLKYATTFRDNFKTYGSFDWYDWRIKNWGCKNDVRDAELEDGGLTLCYSFLSPWSAPEHAINKLFNMVKEKFPDDDSFEVVLQFQDESERSSVLAKFDENGATILLDNAPSILPY